jgi:hypothetical protein
MAKQLAKKRFSRFARTAFAAIERNATYRWIAARSVPIRLLIAAPVFVFGLFAWLTPVPGGVAMLLLSGAIVLPIKSFRSWFYRATHRSRALSVYARWMQWRHERAKNRRHS